MRPISGVRQPSSRVPQRMKKQEGAYPHPADVAEMTMAKEKVTPNKGRKAFADRKKNTQIVLLRMAIMACIDMIGICILLAVRRDASVEMDFVSNWLTPLSVVFGVLTAAAAAYLIAAIVRKTDTSRYPVTPAMLLCVALFCLVACLLYRRVLGVAIIIASVVATVLFMVYCLYMHIFYR